jgi:microcystin-dependent protein
VRVSVPFLSEIKLMAFGFPPKGWAQCNGQLLPINQNQALFSLLGTTYGGDGRITFGLPNLQGRTAIHFGNGYGLGQSGGEQAHTVTIGETPVHTHTAMGTTTTGDSPISTGNYLGGADNLYAPLANTTPIQPTTVANAGGSQPHDNMQPYLVLNFCIALQGLFPSQN